MLYNSPRNDQPSAKTSQTSLTDLSLAIGTAYESIHTFVFLHEKSLIRNFRIFVIILFFLLLLLLLLLLILNNRIAFIRDDRRPEDRECFTIRIFIVDVPGRRELFTCNEDDSGADNYFCQTEICIEDDDGKFATLIM